MNTSWSSPAVARDGRLRGQFISDFETSTAILGWKPFCLPTLGALDRAVAGAGRDTDRCSFGRERRVARFEKLLSDRVGQSK